MASPVEILKRKYPPVYQSFKNGEEDAIRWIVDNVHLLRENKSAYTVVKESRLLSVDKAGKHVYKREAM